MFENKPAIGNHLGPFTEVSNRPDSQELGGGAVGGPEPLQGVIS